MLRTGVFPTALFLEQDPGTSNNSNADVGGVVVGGQYLNIAHDPGINVLGAVIKGGPNTNLYFGDLVGLHSPLTTGTGSNIPDISHWTICYEVDEEPDPARVWIDKVFKGPANYEFGFLFGCFDQQGFIPIQGFALSGGEDAHFEQELDEPVFCAVVEELLGGDWTVNVSVTGGSVEEQTSEDFGTLVIFEVEPGASVNVTFENQPGYLPQPPTGIPPSNPFLQ